MQTTKFTGCSAEFIVAFAHHSFPVCVSYTKFPLLFHLPETRDVPVFVVLPMVVKYVFVSDGAYSVVAIIPLGVSVIISFGNVIVEVSAAVVEPHISIRPFEYNL